MNKFISIILIILFVSQGVFAGEIIDVIENHYSSFASEEIDAYISTFADLKENENTKRENVKKIWQAIDTLEYSLSNFNVDQKDDFAIVTYDVYSKIYFSSERKIVEDSYRLSTILINENNKWGIIFSGDEAGVNSALQSTLMQEEIPIYQIEAEQNSCGDGICEINENCKADCTFIEFDSEKEVEGELIDLKLNQNNTCNYTKDFPRSGNIPKEIPEFLRSDMRLKGIITDNGEEYFVEIKNGEFNFYDDLENLNYIISTDSCTISGIVSGDIDPLYAYNSGLIKVESQDFVSSITTFIANIIVSIINIFNPQPFSLIIEAETGVPSNFGRYSYIGPTSRGPGEVYLGDGGASATYEFESSYAGVINLYVLVSDDSKHTSGARNATFLVNGNEIKYNHKSVDYISSGEIWGKELVGQVNLVSGKNTIKVTKDSTTSAAFVMDKMILTTE